MKNISLLLCASLLLVGACVNTPRSQWKLVWEENFDGPQIDESVWSRIPRGTSDWNDMMSLREDLAYIEDGQLVLLGKVGGEEDETPFDQGLSEGRFPGIRSQDNGYCSASIAATKSDGVITVMGQKGKFSSSRALSLVMK